jgi:hypothetical protein
VPTKPSAAKVFETVDIVIDLQFTLRKVLILNEHGQQKPGGR